MDAVRFAELLDAARELLHDAVLPADHSTQVDCGIRVDTHLFGCARIVRPVRRSDHRLRGDAAVIEAGPSIGALLDQRHVQIELSSPDRSSVACWSRSDHQHVRSCGDISNDHV